MGTRAGRGRWASPGSGVSRWWSLLATLAAGALALRIGPQRTAAVASFTAGASLALLASGKALGAAAVIVSVGAGLFRPCPLAAAAQVLAADKLGRRRFVAMSAVALAFAGSYDAASIVARPAAVKIMTVGTERIVVLLTAGLFILAGLLCGAAAVFSRKRKASGDAPPSVESYRSPASGAERPTASAVRPSHALRGVVALLAPIMLVVSVGFLLEVPNDARRSALAGFTHPFVRSLVAFFFAALALAATRRNLTWPLLAVWAVALVVYGAGLVPAIWSIHAGEVVDDSPFFISALLSGIATPLLLAIPLVYVAFATRARFATLGIAVWTIGCRVLPHPILVRTWLLGRPLLLVLIAVACAVAGFGVLRVSRDLHRSFFERGSEGL